MIGIFSEKSGFFKLAKILQKKFGKSFWVKKPCFRVKKFGKSSETPVLGLKTAVSENSKLKKILEFILCQR